MGSSSRSNIIIVLRREINDQIKNFINEIPKPEDGEYEVDHHEPIFKQLVIDFEKETGKSITKLTTELLKDWKSYHQNHAKLRWLPKKENRELGKRKLSLSIVPTVSSISDSLYSTKKQKIIKN